MSNALYAAVPASFDSGIASFTATNGWPAKILVDTQSAAAATATTPLYYGGATIIDGTISSTDSASKDVQFYRCKVLSTITGTTTTSTIPRASGSYITDGWKVGDVGMLFAPVSAGPNAAVDGILFTVTGVVALTLTLNGTPIAALALAANTRVCKVSPTFKTAVAANSGTNNAVSNVAILGNGMDSGSTVKTERKLGANDIFACAMGSAVSALPAYVTVEAQFARY